MSNEKEDKVNDLLKSILESIKNKEDINKIKLMIKQYSILRMQLDFDNIYSCSLIGNIANYIIEFIDRAQNKGYITDENVYDILERVIIKKFSDRCSSYGDYQIIGILRLNLKYGGIPDYIGLKHIVFHELTHAITPLINGDGGVYQYKIHIKKQNLITINSTTDNVIPIFDEDAKTFLREVIAEATACDLLDDYRELSNINGGGSSDWLVPYNRRYQSLAFLFLKVVYSDIPGISTDREMFKKLTIDAINTNNDIIGYIMNRFETSNSPTWKEDLYNVTKILGNFLKSRDASQVDASEYERAVTILKKYLPQIQIIRTNFRK